jgi:hypothetical protein
MTSGAAITPAIALIFISGKPQRCAPIANMLPDASTLDDKTFI